LAWVISQPGTCAIAGARNPEQVLENAKSVEVRLTPSDLAEIDRIGRKVSDPLKGDPVMWNF
jgi:aryl-alcohol dehydrogenase-like predicted oxidoreductase